MTWILTAPSAQRVELLNPTPEMIHVKDIAYHLAGLNRFVGGTRYNVADHSMRVAEVVPDHLKLCALLHDATEAYLGDMSAPLKRLIPEYKKLERRWWSVIAERFDLPLDMPALVKYADLTLLATERRDLMPDHPDDWEVLKGVEPLEGAIRPLDASQSCQLFEMTFSRYGGRG